MKKAIICSGYFNPLGSHHLEFFENAKEKADMVIAVVNNDKQRELKGSIEFQDEDERLKIIRGLRNVDIAYKSIDTDRTQIETIKMLWQRYTEDAGIQLAFGNGGDQTNESIPETDICEALGIELIDGLGPKVGSSSWTLKKLESQKQ